jgi:hypothetical protein
MAVHIVANAMKYLQARVKLMGSHSLADAAKDLVKNWSAHNKLANRRIRVRDEYNCRKEDALAFPEGDIREDISHHETTVLYQCSHSGQVFQVTLPRRHARS